MTSKILNQSPTVKLQTRAPGGHRFAPVSRDSIGGAGVTYILAWMLGPPVSIIVLFWLMFGF